MMTPKQRAELAARECAERLSERLFWNREARLQIIQPYQVDIQESIPLEQLFAVEDALRTVSKYVTINNDVTHFEVKEALLALDNWRKEREKK